MMGFPGGWGWGGWFAMAVLLTLFWGLAIAGVLAFVHFLGGARQGTPADEGAPGRGRPAELLAERFARGEIGEDEYRQRLSLLRDGPVSPARRRGAGLAGVTALAAVVLGVVTTVALAAGGIFPGAVSSARRTSNLRCAAPTLAGQVVDVTAADMGHHMMGGAHGQGPAGGGPGPFGRGMMRLFAAPDTVSPGTVSLRVVNTGGLTHEVVVLPLQPGQAAGERHVGHDGRVSEAGSLGEASRSCAGGAGEGITSRAVGWTTLRLPSGRFELVCNFPGHYAAGMYTELDVASR